MTRLTPASGTSAPHGAASPRTVLTRYAGIVRRNYAGALVEASVAVWRGVPIDAFLLRRLRCYEALAPQDLRPLATTIEIVDGDVKVSDGERGDVYMDASSLEEFAERRGVGECARDLAAARDRELQLNSGRVTRAATEIARIEAELPQVETQLRTLEAELEREVAAGVATPPCLDKPDASRIGRFLERSAPAALSWLVTIAVLGIEGYQLALPYLDMTGVDGSDLETAWAINPQGVVAGFGFAGASTAMMFVVAKLMVDAVHSLWSDPHSAARFAAKSAFAFIMAALLTSTAIGLASFRHELGTAGQALHATIEAHTADTAAPLAGSAATSGAILDPKMLAALTFLLLTLGLPLALACIHLKRHIDGAGRRAAEKLERTARDATAAARASFDRHEAVIRPWRERYARLQADLAGAERALLAAQQAEAQAITACDRAITELRDRLRDELANEHRAMRAWALETVAAVELDRLAFTKAARRRHKHLLSRDGARDLPSQGRSFATEPALRLS